MTCCIAIEIDHGFVVGADSAVSTGGVCAEQASKCAIYGDCSLLCAGHLGWWQRVRDLWVERRDGCKETSLESVVRAVRSIPFQENSAGDLLHVGPSGIHVIDAFGACSRPRDKYFALGSGYELAMGWLGGVLGYELAEHGKLTEPGAVHLAKACLEFVAERCAGVRAPFEILAMGPGSSDWVVHEMANVKP